MDIDALTGELQALGRQYGVTLVVVVLEEGRAETVLALAGETLPGDAVRQASTALGVASQVFRRD